MIELLLFASFFALLLLSVPVAFAIGLAAAIAVFMTSGFGSLISLPGVMQHTLASDTLLAIPFFILAGVIMEFSGISRRLIDLANALMGRLKTGLALVVIVAAFFFSAISGSGPATVAAIGSILIPAMVARGYKPSAAAGLMASSGSLGIVIPPSLTLIIFGVVASDYETVSIGRLFMASIVPGVILALGLYGVVLLRHRTMLAKPALANTDNLHRLEVGLTARGVGRNSAREDHDNGDLAAAASPETGQTVLGAGMSSRKIFTSVVAAIPGLIVPVIILGGIYGGVFTPAESAIVAAVYATVIGVFVYRDLNFGDFYRLGISAVKQSSVVMIIVGCASMFGYVVTRHQIAESFADLVFSISSNSVIVMLLCILLLLAIGAFIDAISALYLFVPILVPVLLAVGYDITTLGVMMTINLAAGLLTPPVGVNLFVAAGLAKESLWNTSKASFPYLLVAVGVTIAVAFIPALSNWLPNLLS